VRASWVREEFPTAVVVTALGLCGHDSCDCRQECVQDGLRDGKNLRHPLTERFRQVLAASGVPWVGINGTRTRPVTAALKFIAANVGPGWVPFIIEATNQADIRAEQVPREGRG
jgi:hypothetical protein